MLVSVTSTVSNHDVDVDEFSSFLFWRQPLPSVDLDDLEAVIRPASNGRLASANADDVADGPAADFDEFNYWRVPIPQLNVDDLLRCLRQL